MSSEDHLPNRENELALQGLGLGGWKENQRRLPDLGVFLLVSTQQDSSF